MAASKRAKVADLNGMPLVRRARYLESRLAKGTLPGRQFDVAEYLAFVWIFEAAGVAFEPAISPELLRGGGEQQPQDARMEEPPVRPATEDTFVPGEPRSRRYMPRGSV